jgi:hypothetical protein
MDEFDPIFSIQADGSRTGHFSRRIRRRCDGLALATSRPMQLERALFLFAMTASSGLFIACSAPAPADSEGATQEPPITSSRDAASNEEPPVRDGGADSGHQHPNLDGGGDVQAPSPTSGAFAGAPPYKTGAPSTRANDEHFFVNMTGKACLECHDGSGFAPRFVFAGTAYRGTAPARGAEIRVVSGTNALVGAVYADEDGNFWMKGLASASGVTGARSASGASLMNAKITSGDCNSSSCHGPSRRITVP